MANKSLLSALKDESLIDYNDYDKTRNHYYSKIMDAVKHAFPVENKKYRLEARNLSYQGPEKVTPDDEREAVLKGKDLARRVKGQLVLYDRESGKPVDKTGNTTLLSLPVLTDRGEFVRKGVRYSVPKQLRLDPGVYTRIAQNNMIDASFNPDPSTGHNFKTVFDPDKLTFHYQSGNRSIPLVYLLKRMGVEEDTLKNIMGENIYKVNDNMRPSPHAVSWLSSLEHQPGEKEAQEDNKTESGITDHFRKMKLNPRSTERTLGKPYESITPEVLLRSMEKILNINKGKEDTDDRDSLAYQKLHDFSDMISEKITRDQNRVLGNQLWNVTRRGDLQKTPTGLLNKHLDHFFTKSGLAQSLAEFNPIESHSQNNRVVKVGEGGIPSVQQAPLEARSVQSSYAGIIDPVRGPESSRVGLDMYISENTRRGKDDKLLYSQFLRPDNGEREWVNTEKATDSVIAFPDMLTSDKKYVPAIIKGDRMGTVDRNKVDYIIPSGDEMFSATANFVPFKSGVKAMRLLMGSKYPNQAMPLVNRESPLVETGLYYEGEGNKKVSEHLGKYAGTKSSPVTGTVESVHDKFIKVKDKDGESHKVYLNKNLPLARKTVLDNEPKVQAGDTVKKGDTLAVSNFTDKEGKFAPGTNLRVGFMNHKGKTFEDAVVVSESAAENKLKHTALYPYGMDKSEDIKFDKNKFRTLFPSRFSRNQMEKIDDKGVIKEGSKVEYGDPLLVGVKENVPQLSSLGRRVSLPEFETWEHQSPGIVTDIADTKDGYKVFVKTQEPHKEGDKVTLRSGVKGVAADIVPDDKMPKDENGDPLDIIVSRLTIPSRVSPEALIEAALGKVAAKRGEPYSLSGFSEEELWKFAKEEAKKHNVKLNENLEDPETGQKIPNILTGNIFVMKPEQVAESKGKGRSTDFYTYEGTPGRGGPEGAKHMGSMELEGLMGHSVPEVIKDIKMIKGQKNTDFWRDVRSGRTPTLPSTPVVYQKFKDLLRGAGIHYAE